MGRDPVQTAARREPRKVAHGPRVRCLRRHPPVVACGQRPETASRLGRARKPWFVRDSGEPYRVSSRGWRSAVHHEYDVVQEQGGDMPLVDCHWPRRRWLGQGRVE